MQTNVFTMIFFSFNPKPADINECETIKPCHDHATCNNTRGGYVCSCNEGFIGNGTHCEDDDECQNNPCSGNANCTNTIGSFQCVCLEGWKGTGVGQNGCQGILFCFYRLENLLF